MTEVKVSGPPHVLKFVVVDKLGHITCQSFCSSKSYFIALKLYLLDSAAIKLGWKSAPIILLDITRLKILVYLSVYICECAYYCTTE